LLSLAQSYASTALDYAREPSKPVIDGEPLYEDHPSSFKAAEFGYSIAADVRRPLYWDLFNGACGHTYGNHSIWQMYEKGRRVPVNAPLMDWSEALSEPGSAEMQFGRWLMESRPYLTRIPDPSLVVEQDPSSAWPGAGLCHFSGTRDEEGSYAMVYAPIGRKFTVRLDSLSGPVLRAWWFSPRDGTSQLIGEFPKVAQREFLPPNPGEFVDWVLVIDDAAKKFPAPGTRQ
jgi:hypothetical protein